jgi:hypothetical protein
MIFSGARGSSALAIQIVFIQPIQCDRSDQERSGPGPAPIGPPKGP